MPRKLTELRPCDKCSKPVGGVFTVLRWSVAVVNQRAVNEYFGMHQFFQGKATDALVENFAPAMAEGFTIAMDEPEYKQLTLEAFICQTCAINEIDLGMLMERLHARRDDNVTSVRSGPDGHSED
jgi:hypothetical protein